MNNAPIIPFGYKQVHGQSQKGDGIWNGTCFAKVKKGYPFVGDAGLFIIRRCEVVQPEIDGVGMTGIDFDKEENL